MSKRRQTRADAVLKGPDRIQNFAWWERGIDAEEAGQRVSAVVRHIRQRTIWRRELDLLHAELYGGGPAAAGIVLNNRAAYQYQPTQMPRNVCRQAVDTLQAKTAKHRPLPQALTSRGNWAQMKRAKKLTQYLEGVFTKTKFFRTFARNMVRDAGAFGRGVVKAFRRGKHIRLERVHPWELLVDDWDARYGEPRSLYHVRTLDVGVACALFGDDENGEVSEELWNALVTSAGSAPADEWDWQGAVDASVNRVRIVEAWHLCDDQEAHDDDEEHQCNGRHTITILGGRHLVDEPFMWDRFPFGILNYSDPLAGFWGVGVVEQLEGWQLAINEQFGKVQEGHHMLGGGMIFVAHGSDVVDTSFHNGVVPIIKFKGTPPQFETPAPIHPAVYQRERDMPQDALGEVGLTLTSAQGQKQPGINSGIALQTMDDIEDERHIIFGRMYEDVCLELAEIFILIESEIAEEYGESETLVPMNGGLLPLKWSAVKLDDFQLRVFPTSMLPQQLGARIEYLNNLLDRGAIDLQTYKQQLGGPDAMAELDLETADRLNIDEKLEAIIDADDGEELDGAAQRAVPSEYQDYSWMQKRAQQRYNQGQIDGVPEANLEELRQVMVACQAIIDRKGPSSGAQQAPQMPPGMPPGGAPMPGIPGPAMPPGAIPPAPMMPTPPPVGPMPMGNA